MKRIKFLFLVLLGCFVLYYVFLMVSPAFTPKVNDSDLRLERRLVASTNNGFHALLSATNDIWWPAEQWRELYDLSRGTNWDANLAATALTSNQTALAAFDLAVKAADFQVPEYQFADSLDYVMSWKAFAQIASLRAYVSFNAGQEGQAFEQALDIIRLGARMENCQGPILSYLVGSAVKSIGLSLMQDLTSRTQLEPKELIRLAQRLPVAVESRSALTNALQCEYKAQLAYLADLRSGKALSDYAPLARVRILPIYNERKTHGKFAAHMRSLLWAAGQPFLTGEKVLLKQKPGVAQVLLGGNFTGEIMFNVTMPAVDGVIKTKCREAVKAKATITLIALKAYQTQQGKLPATLQELVPDYLSAVPTDDFDGQPLRYRPADRLIYSVGSDCKDDGGIETDARQHTPDFIFPF